MNAQVTHVAMAQHAMIMSGITHANVELDIQETDAK